jgi:hypothetical protein
MAKTALTQPAFVAQLRSALTVELRGAKVTCEQIRGNRYRFIVLWKEFDQMGHPERQQRVWDIAESSLEPRDLLNVGMILTLGAEDQGQQ